MEYSKIINKAWQITYHNRTLWLFGLLLAFFAGGASSSTFNNFSFQNVNIVYINLLLRLDFDLLMLIVVILSSIGGIWVLAGVFIQPITIAAILGLEQELAEGYPINKKLGFQLGWSRWAVHIFLVNLLVGLTTSIMFACTFCVALSPLLLVMVNNQPVQLLGGGAFASFLCVWLFIRIIFSVFITPFIELGQRYVVLGNMNAIRSLEQSYHLFKAKFRDLLGGILILLAFNLAWRVVTGIFMALLWGLITLMVAFSSTGTSDWVQIISTMVWIGSIFGGIVLAIGWLYIRGLFLTFQLTFWSITFKEVNLRYF